MNDVLRNIQAGLAGSSPLDLLNLILGVAGVWLMTRRSLWAFPVGLVAVTVQGVLFWRATFYADAKLQVFFFVCLVYGWWHWTRDKGDAPELPVTTLRWRTRAIYALATTALWMGWGWFQSVHTDAAQPYRDTFIASFSVAAQILQVRKHLENWFVWLLVNGVAITAYWSADLAFTAFLYLIYLGLAVGGWIAWHRARKEQPVHD